MKLTDEFTRVGSYFLKSRYGFIKAHRRNDGYLWIDEVYVYPKYRGRGYAGQMIDRLPRKVMLLAYPMMKKGESEGLDLGKLISFYKSKGFRYEPDAQGNPIMVRD